MTMKVADQEAVSAKLIDHWEQVSQKLAALAEEIPAAKINYRPLDGVRTFADVLRHVAFWNRYVADKARRRKAHDSANEISKDEFSTKAQLIAELRRGATDAAEALREVRSNLNPETAEIVIAFIEHTSEHYGQLAVYVRLSGITPPTSRS